MIGSSALRIRAVSAALALVAGIGLLAYQPASLPAGAADQGRLTDSAVTLQWSDGLTGADNSTVIEPRDTADPRYDDFDGLEVTIAQTEGIRSQAIDITWSGWRPASSATTDYTYSVQVMQCWAEDDTGPTPETCVWGPHPDPGAPQTGRGVDVSDPRADEAPDPAYEYPFQAVYGGDPTTLEDLPFDQWTTTEVRAAKSDANGDGEVIFTVQDGTDAPHLGCGLTTDDGEPRDCWLVILPRGGTDYAGVPLISGLDRVAQFAFSPSNWAHRMQVRLDFDSIDAACPEDNVHRRMAGSQLAAEAVHSWQPALCQGDGAATYDYIPTSDAEGRRQLVDNIVGSAGLAFTTAPAIPRVGGPEMEVRHAPVAVSGAAVAFNLENADRSIVNELRLSPRLVAKLLTQSYVDDLPGQAALDLGDQAPLWWDGGTGVPRPPANILADPEFQALNEHVTAPAFSGIREGGVRIRVSGSSADAVRELWRWVQADAEAAAWLNGEPDEQGMVVNPFFEELDLDEPPAIDTMLREVDRCWLESAVVPEPGLCSLDWIPYTNGLEDSARQARLGAPGGRGSWDVNALSPTNTQGWFGRLGPHRPGSRAIFAITDTASAARYGLPTAALRNAAGEFVAPTGAGMEAAVEAMVPDEDVDDLLAIDPEADAAAAYPLTMVTYAAVRDTEEPDVLAHYADFLRYAAGPGQQAGIAAGQLPEGYLPLNEELRAQTLAVADELTAVDPPATPPGFTPSGEGDPGDEDPGGDDGTADGGEAGGDPSGGPDGTGADDGLPSDGDEAPDPNQVTPGTDGGDAAPPPDGAAGDGPGDAAPPGVDDTDPVAQATPGEPVGPMQYVLFVVLIVGLAGALGGPALLRLAPRHA